MEKHSTELKRPSAVRCTEPELGDVLRDSGGEEVMIGSPMTRAIVRESIQAGAAYHYVERVAELPLTAEEQRDILALSARQRTLFMDYLLEACTHGPDYYEGWNRDDFEAVLFAGPVFGGRLWHLRKLDKGSADGIEQSTAALALHNLTFLS